MNQLLGVLLGIAAWFLLRVVLSGFYTVGASQRAVEIETLKAQADDEPLRQMAAQLVVLQAHGPAALAAYARTVKLALFAKADRVIAEVKS